MKLSPFLSTALLAALLIGCKGSDSPEQGTTGGAATGSPKAKTLKIGVVFDSGGRGDKSFNDSAWAGIERAQKEFSLEVADVDTRSPKDYEGNIRGLAEKGMDLIFAVGITQQDALKAVAPQFPDVKFVSVDGQVDGDNVRNLQFKEEQGSFLVGYLAGLMTKANKVGFVGGMDIPTIRRFEAGYRAGVLSANPKIEILPAKFTESWDDVTTGKAAGKTLFDAGADIVYHAAGRAGLGVIDAAEDADKFAIGVDSDQDYVSEGHVLTSMIKHVDVGVYQTIKDVQEGKFSGGTKVYELKDGGVGLSDLKYTKQIIGREKLQKVEAMKQKIIDGSLKVPASMDELKGFAPK
ncbi:MAG: BMP family protein [Fimbriimonas sp.]